MDRAGGRGEAADAFGLTSTQTLCSSAVFQFLCSPSPPSPSPQLRSSWVQACSNRDWFPSSAACRKTTTAARSSNLVSFPQSALTSHPPGKYSCHFPFPFVSLFHFFITPQSREARLSGKSIYANFVGNRLPTVEYWSGVNVPPLPIPGRSFSPSLVSTEHTR